MKKFFLLIIAISIFDCLHSQAWNTAIFKVDILPDFNISNYNQLLIAEVVNEKGKKDLSSQDLSDELFNSMFELGVIDVVDREKVDILLNEMEFQESGYVDEPFVMNKGKFKGAGLIMVGRIQTFNYDEKVDKEDKFVTVNGCGVSNRRIGSYIIQFNLRLIDLETSEVIFSKTIDLSRTAKSPSCDCCTPSKINKDDLKALIVKDFGEEVKRVFSGYEKQFEVVFQKHKLINEKLQEAVINFRVNENEEALKLLSEIVTGQNDKKAKSAGLYNLAVTQFYMFQLFEARDNAKEAYVLNPKNEEALALFNSIDNIIGD